VSTASLAREVRKLRERREARRRDIPSDRVEFARSLGLEADRWQERLLRSDAARVLMNCARQTGKSTSAGVLALH
jgi:hypothetical protein